jgi:hypothetical protein
MEHGTLFRAKTSLVRLRIAKLLSLFFGVIACGDRRTGDRCRQVPILGDALPPVLSTRVWNLECL